jgi:hypothetical protein
LISPRLFSRKTGKNSSKYLYKKSLLSYNEEVIKIK